jgi:anti-sigma-K factor RskA
MKPLTLDELRDLAPAFVMGTLSLEEQRAFEGAMADATVAAALEPELSAHRAAAEFLSTSHAVTPPSSLKARVLSRIAAENANASAPSPIPKPIATATPVDTSVRDINSRRGRGGWLTAGVLAVALAASLVLLLDVKKEALGLRGQIASQSTDIEKARTQLAEREKLLATILGSGTDVTLVRLSPNQPKGPGMQVFWNVKEGRATVTASGLAPIARDRAYALWMIRDGKPVALALFNPDASGRAVVQDITVPTAMQGVAAFAVTEEPAAGSPQPTMTPFLVGAVPK